MNLYIRVFLLLAIYVINIKADFSPFSVKGMGLENSNYSARELAMGYAGMASVPGVGPSILGGARLAYNNLTSFHALLKSEWVYLESPSTSNTMNANDVPQINLNFPAGWLGHLGLSYHQRFLRNFEYVSRNQNGLSENLIFEAGNYEVLLQWARSITPAFSVGLDYHMLMGRDRKIIEADFEDVNFADLEGDTVLTRRSGYYPSLSLMYRHKKFNVSLYGSIPGTVDEKTTRRIHRENSDIESNREFDLPLKVALGFNYKHSVSQNYVLDFSYSNWDDEVDADANASWNLGFGYEYQGQGGRYASYYKNMSYRAGLGMERLYVLEANEYRLTGGLGFPLGSRGSVMDFALVLGQRGSLDKHDVREGFVKFYLSLTGTGLWGKTSRRR